MEKQQRQKYYGACADPGIYCRIGQAEANFLLGEEPWLAQHGYSSSPFPSLFWNFFPGSSTFPTPMSVLQNYLSALANFWCHLDPKPHFTPSPLGTGASVSSSVSWAGGCHPKSLISRPRWDPVCGHCSHGDDGGPVLNLQCTGALLE